ncbi:MAG: amidohydrolase [Bryobacteraceae bacterium]
MRGLLALALCTGLQAADADLILHNGKIVTVDARFSIREAVAVKDGKIAAVGTSREILNAERGAGTQVIDLQGKTVLPGLIDSHVHALSAGLSEFRQPLAPLGSFAQVQAFIRAQAAKTPKGQWIVVPRTFPTRLAEMRMPTREVLDVATEHPVLFDASYSVVVNSFALKMSGIGRETPDPPGGVIVRDSKGEPNGILKNAQRLLKGERRSGGAQFSDEERLQALEAQLKRYVDAGLTSISDRAVTAADIALYRKLKAAGRLPIRSVLTWRLDASQPLEALQKQIREAGFHTGTGDEWLNFGAFKVTLDGGMTIGTAFQRHPYGEFGRVLYGQTDPDDRGQLFIPLAKLNGILGTAREEGWQLTAHSQGGGAIDALLTAFEALNREKPIAPTRSHLMHASFQSPEALAKAKALGVHADVQPAWLYFDADALEKVFTTAGMRYFFPLRSYREKGIIIAGGSDHMIGFDKDKAVNPYNPFMGMWTAVTRKTVRGRVIHGEERIGREDALRMYTVWGAYLQHADDVRGSIEKGRLADLVVIDRDYMTCPEDQIKDIQPVTVILDGKIVKQRR